MPFVITISRQLGSGGSYVGQQISQRLNIFYADREIIREAANQLSLLEEELESRDEKISSFWKSFFQSFAFVEPDVYIPQKNFAPTDLELFKTESGIIKRIAEERSSVIIGRCGSFILRDHPNHISIFLHSDKNFRKERIKNIYNISEKAAEKMIERCDKERALYYRKFTGKDWMDMTQYNITIDTAKIGLDNCLELIMKYIQLIGKC